MRRPSTGAGTRSQDHTILFSELMRVAHWDEGGQYFSDRTSDNPVLMRDHFGNMCKRVGARRPCRRTVDDDVCVRVEVDLYRSLMSGQGKQCNNTQGRKDRKWKECKIAADDLEWQSFVERESLQRCQGTHIPTLFCGHGHYQDK